MFFFQIGVVNSRNRYFIYYTCWFYRNYFILKGFVSFWTNASSFLENFLKIHHYEYFLTTIAVSMVTGTTFIFAHDVGNLMYFLNVYTFTLLSHTYEKLWTGMQAYVRVLIIFANLIWLPNGWKCVFMTWWTYCVMNTEQTSENIFTYACYNFHKTVRNSNWKK